MEEFLNGIKIDENQIAELIKKDRNRTPYIEFISKFINRLQEPLTMLPSLLKL